LIKHIKCDKLNHISLEGIYVTNVTPVMDYINGIYAGEYTGDLPKLVMLQKDAA
jgi:hypothetical protein